MTEPIHKGKDLPPVWVIHAASGGDSEAMEQVLRYYDDYMSRLCTRTLYDKDGTPHVCVDRAIHRLPSGVQSEQRILPLTAWSVPYAAHHEPLLYDQLAS